MAHYTPIDMFIAATAIVIIPAVSAWSGKRLAVETVENRRLAPRYWWIILRSVAIMLLILVAWARLARPVAALGLSVPVNLWGRVGFGIDAGIAAYYLYAIVLRKRSVEELRRTRDRLRRMKSDRMLPRTAGEYRLFAAVAVLGSVAEELLYRGFLIWFFAPVVGTFGAVVLSSAAFSLGHVYLGRVGMVRTAAIGTVFGFAFVLTRSLWWLMLAHVTVNLFGAPLQRRLRQDVAPQLE